MKHFLSELKLNNPNLVLDDNGFRKEAAWYMSNSRDSVTPVPGSNAIRDRAREVRDSLFSTVDLLPLFLKDTTNISDYYKEGNIEKFSGSLYDIAEDMMCLPELKMKRTFRKYFTKDQLYTIFLANSISWLISPGYYKGMTPIYKRGYFILKHMFDNAEEIIKNNEHGAFLRFSHDGFMMHLLRALELDGSREVPTDFLNVCDHFSLFQAIPMGSNVQIVFYRKTGSDDILVKFLLQEEEKHIPLETDIWPYYHWKDVKAFYYPKIKSYLRTRN